MGFKNIFENKEFKGKWDLLIDKVSTYLEEHEYDLGELEVSNLVTWFDMPNTSIRKVRPSENCLEDIKNIVGRFCSEIFPVDKNGNPVG